MGCFFRLTKHLSLSIGMETMGTDLFIGTMREPSLDVLHLLPHTVRQALDGLDHHIKILREILKGMLREVTAYFFRKNVLENKKTTLRRRKQKGGSHK